METETIKPIDDFIKRHNLTIEAVRGERPKRLDGWEADDWQITIRGAGRVPFSCWFSCGIGHRVFSVREARKIGVRPPWVYDGRELKDGDRWPQAKARTTYEAELLHAFIPLPPTLEAVLESLAMDCSHVSGGQSWREFAADCGYDPDSIKDRKVYKACRKQWRKLVRSFGAAFVEELQLVEF